MGRNNYVEELEYSIAQGVDTTSPVSLLQPGYVRQALNTNIGTTGGYVKRDGCVKQLTTPWSGLAIRNGVEYRMLNGTTQKLVFGTNDVGIAKLGKLDGVGGVSDLVTGLSASNRLAFAQIDERLYAFNGDSVNAPFVYEGITTRELGLDPPTNAPTGSGSTGGSLDEGPYIFSYTYAIRNSTTFQIIAESSPSDFLNLTLTSGQNRAILGVVASLQTVSGSLEIVIRIWRTVPNGSVPFLADTVPNVTGNINVDAADAELDTRQLELDNSRLEIFDGYTKAKYPVIARNRLFVVHENRNEARFSKISQNGPMIESFPALNLSSLEGIHGASDKVVGLGQINGVPIVLKERSVGRLEEVGLPDITQAEDLVTYIYREISQTIGGVDHFAQCQVFEELVFLGKDNVYATDGQRIRPIAPLIQETIRGCDFRPNKKNKVSMTNDTKFRRIYIQVFENQASSEPTLTLVGDYQRYPDFRWTFYSKGTDSTTHPGFRAGSFFQLTNDTDGSLETYFGNSNKDGNLYKMNTGTFDDDNGTERGIFFKVISRPYMMGAPLITKLYKRVRIFAQATDDTYQLEFCSIFDLSSEEEFCEDFTIPGTGNNWDEHNWVDDPETEADPLVWAGPALAELEYDPHRKAKFMQLVFNQPDKDAPVTLLGWGVSGSIFSGI
jgi:hypothetical protein